MYVCAHECIHMCTFINLMFEVYTYNWWSPSMPNSMASISHYCSLHSRVCFQQVKWKLAFIPSPLVMTYSYVTMEKNMPLGYWKLCLCGGLRQSLTPERLDLVYRFPTSQKTPVLPCCIGSCLPFLTKDFPAYDTPCLNAVTCGQSEALT